MASAVPRWMARAACAGSFGELFFPDNEAYEGRRSNQSLAAQAERAIAQCDTCPVKQQCGEFARGLGVDTGVWGGVWLDRPGVGNNAEKTRCVNGHRFTEENTARDHRGHRRCKACNREHASKAWDKKRTETAA